ncbi:KIAA1841 [Bugula neritina]|nr:KIAA1841 [Bugula neritina]
MDNLIEKCIVYCHRHMNAILATPCNMNCINDRLVTKIGALFSHNEVEELRDRKDKFRSKLFAKKVEKLFDCETLNASGDSPENASTLYKCKACEKLLTKTLEKKLPCIISRMLVNRQGELVYVHERDVSWDVNDFLVDLKQDLKGWREVYWRLWGIINWLYCSRCKRAFQCCELAGCLHHKDKAVFQADVMLGKLSGAVGTYLCCGERVIRFDPSEETQGCEVRDHIVEVEDSEEGQVTGNTVYEDLLAYRQAITVTVEPPKPSTLPMNVFANDEFVCGLRDDGIGMSKQPNMLKQPAKSSDSFQQPKLQALTHEIYEDESFSDRSDDEIGDDETKHRIPRHLKRKRTHVTVKPAAILVDGPQFRGHQRNKWDSSRSVRFNQDAQRQEDIIRQRDIINYLTKLRIGADKLDKYKQKEYAGGIYSKLEAQFRTNLAQTKANSISGPRSSRNKVNSVKTMF